MEKWRQREGVSDEPRIARSAWELEEAGRGLSWNLQRERGPTNTLILNWGFQKCERMHFCCFKPPDW